MSDSPARLKNAGVFHFSHETCTARACLLLFFLSAGFFVFAGGVSFLQYRHDCARFAEFFRELEGRASALVPRFQVRPGLYQRRYDLRRLAEYRRRVQGRAAFFIPRLEIGARLLESVDDGRRFALHHELQ